MIKIVQYKGFEIKLNHQIINSMRSAIQKDNAINIIDYLLDFSTKDGYTLDRYHRIACMIRNIFFAMNPAHPEYEKIRIFFEYSDCITYKIPPFEFFNQKDINICITLMELRNVFTNQQSTYL
jgi:hypothetical protein